MASEEARRIRATFVKATEPDTRPIDVQRREWEVGAQQIPLPTGVTVTSVDADGVHGEWVRAESSDTNAVMLFLHGGGFNAGSCITHRGFAAQLALACGIPVLTVDYRLAPEHPFPAGVEDAMAVYRWLRSQGYATERIVLGGDSAGGGLVASTLVKLRDEGEALPNAAVLLSPMLDMALTGESLGTRRDVDPLTTEAGLRRAVDLYMGEQNRYDPVASPVYADLTGLPPLFIQVGDHEILLSDAVRLAERAQASGVEVTLQIWPAMWHVFPAGAPALPEGQQALDQISVFVRQRLAITT